MFIKYHHLVLLLLVQPLIGHLLIVSIVIGLLLLLFLLKSQLLVLVVQLVLINLILCWVLVVTRDENLVLGRHLVMLILLLLVNIKARVKGLSKILIECLVLHVLVQIVVVQYPLTDALIKLHLENLLLIR